MSSTEIKNFAQAFSTPALLVKAACKSRATPLLPSADGEILNAGGQKKFLWNVFVRNPRRGLPKN